MFSFRNLVPCLCKEDSLSPVQLCLQLGDFHTELQVCVFTLSHHPQQAALLLAQLLVSLLQFSHSAPQILFIPESK